jgi:ribose/xylose/arabinose/galactoside ABC-type transport system permease subunit
MSVPDTARRDPPRDLLIRFVKAPEWGLVAGLLVVLVLIHFLDRDRAFFRPYSLQTLLHRVALFGVLAVGAAVVIIAGGIDLSIGAVVALASVVSAKLLTDWIPRLFSAWLPRLLETSFKGWLPAGWYARAQDGLATLAHLTKSPSAGLIAVVFVVTLGLGLAIGLGHSLMINRLRLPPFIATLATMAGLRSLATLLSQNRTINVPFESYRVWGSNPWHTLAIFGGVAALMSIIMGWTVLGRHLFALGGNETAARLSGLRTRRLKAIAYGLSGILSALGGILFTGLSGQADSRLGVTYELTAITAAVVGGCSLAGGVGSVRGTVLGLLLTQIVIKGTGIVVRGVDSTQIEGLVLGTVVVLAVSFNQLTLRDGLRWLRRILRIGLRPG